MNTKLFFSSLIISTILLGGVFILATREDASPQNTPSQNDQSNTSTEDGKQIIEILAKGRYTPQNSFARANVPTVLKIKTNGTFDCSSALTIPSLNYQAYLPPSGETLIDVPPQKPGTSLLGVCAMGMYSFTVLFT